MENTCAYKEEHWVDRDDMFRRYYRTGSWVSRTVSANLPKFCCGTYESTMCFHGNYSGTNKVGINSTRLSGRCTFGHSRVTPPHPHTTSGGPCGHSEVTRPHTTHTTYLHWTHARARNTYLAAMTFESDQNHIVRSPRPAKGTLTRGVRYDDHHF